MFEFDPYARRLMHALHAGPHHPAFVLLRHPGYYGCIGGDDALATVAGSRITQEEFDLAQRQPHRTAAGRASGPTSTRSCSRTRKRGPRSSTAS